MAPHAVRSRTPRCKGKKDCLRNESMLCESSKKNKQKTTNMKSSTTHFFLEIYSDLDGAALAMQRGIKEKKSLFVKWKHCCAKEQKQPWNQKHIFFLEIDCDLDGTALAMQCSLERLCDLLKSESMRDQRLDVNLSASNKLQRLGIAVCAWKCK